MTTSVEPQTAAACVRTSCRECRLDGQLMCIHSRRDLIEFGVLVISWLIPFFAGMIMGRHWAALAVWFGLAVLFFTYIEALVLCRHCPHYAEPGSTLRCHANWGLPKIPKISPRPLNRTEQWVWSLYAAALFLYELPFFIADGQWVLLVIATWAVIVWLVIMRRHKCNRCYMLSCPLNCVPEEVKTLFYKCYPDYAPESDTAKHR